MRRGADATMYARTLRQAALFDIPGQAVIATDATGRILLWNAAAEELYGWRAEEVLGRSIVEVTPTSLSRVEAADIMSRLAMGLSWSGTFHVQHKDGSTFHVRVMDTPVRNDAGELEGIIGISEREGGSEGADPRPGAPADR
jgi:PAS domain S-box-containing protein